MTKDGNYDDYIQKQRDELEFNIQKLREVCDIAKEKKCRVTIGSISADPTRYEREPQTSMADEVVKFIKLAKLVNLPDE
jgi:hypothetical protein